jgi:hypothetical protein
MLGNNSSHSKLAMWAGTAARSLSTHKTPSHAHTHAHGPTVLVIGGNGARQWKTRKLAQGLTPLNAS